MLEQSLLKLYGDPESREFLDKNNFSAFLADSARLHQFQKEEIKRELSLVERFKIPRLQ